MRAVWSFWSKPYLERRGLWWREHLHHLLAWGLSLRLASGHFPETALVTDCAGKSLLIDCLGLSFTHVSTELERIRNADAGFWALGKLVAYSLQDQPFVHLDTDVFLWKPLPVDVASAPVFAQCPEDHPLEEWCAPSDIERAFAEYGLTLPAEWEWSRSRFPNHFREENVGILGGTRVDFLRYFANLAIDLIENPDHAPAWATFPDKKFGYNFIVEQFLLAACLDFHRFHPASPFRGIGIRYLFPSMEQAFDQQSAARLGFTHLLGDAKRNRYNMQRLEQRVRREDWAYYEHCRRLSQNPRLFTAAGG